MAFQTKICGIKTVEALEAAVQGGAQFIGLVFFPPSPRHISIDRARLLCQMISNDDVCNDTGNDVRSVGLFVDPTDEQLEEVLGQVPLDMLQLHGHETPARVREIKKRFGLPIMKAFSVSTAADVVRAYTYEDAADWYMFDAKAPEGIDVPGGTGQVFDWALLAEEEFDKPWMLSGGLTPENVGNALMILSPTAVDVSSGVEAVRGQKDLVKIRTFLDAVNKL